MGDRNNGYLNGNLIGMKQKNFFLILNAIILLSGILFVVSANASTMQNSICLTIPGDSGIEGLAIMDVKWTSQTRLSVGSNEDAIPLPREGECIKCHRRSLEKHDVLGAGAGKTACWSCHDYSDIEAESIEWATHGQLQLLNGTTLPLNNPSALCGRRWNDR